MKIDRVVVTSYPGYFFMSVLCLRSVFKYLDQTPVTLLIDDFELDRWPSFVDDYKKYILENFPSNSIEFECYSALDRVGDGDAGGWLRQQLIKLHVDYFVKESNILLVDADVIFNDHPNTTWIAARPVTSANINSPTGVGFRLYCEYMLDSDLHLESQNVRLAASWAPFRFVSRDLLQALRSHVENIHKKNFLDLHIELMQNKKIVWYDPAGLAMVMSEFEMLEIFRKHFWKDPLPLRPYASAYFNDNIEDWKRDPGWFVEQDVKIDPDLWQASQAFAPRPINQ